MTLDKLVNENQQTFIHGRVTKDNIELFHEHATILELPNGCLLSLWYHMDESTSHNKITMCIYFNRFNVSLFIYFSIFAFTEDMR